MPFDEYNVQAMISIDRRTTFQTIEGWGATLHELGNPFDEWLADPTPDNYDRLNIVDPYPDDLRERILDAAVFELGLNRFRLEIGPQVEMMKNNPSPRDWRSLRYKWQDLFITKWLLPANERIEQRGESMVLYISYDLRSSLTPSWLLKPDRYAALSLATLSYLKEKYNLEPDYWSILNEPGNEKRPGNPQMVAELVAVAGSRINRAGFRTKISAPETVSLEQFSDYMEALAKKPEALSQIGQITYHIYRDPKNVEKRREIRNWASALEVTSAQTEWFEGKGLEVAEIVHLDLTEANASAWEQFSLCSLPSRTNAKGGCEYFIVEPNYSGFRWNENTLWLKQYMKYIRPGSVRVHASSSEDTVRVCAFVDPKGMMVTVLVNSGARRKARIAGLIPGEYGLTAYPANSSRVPNSLIVKNAINISLPDKSVVTISQRNRLG